jgi:hypothetical protein
MGSPSSSVNISLLVSLYQQGLRHISQFVFFRETAVHAPILKLGAPEEHSRLITCRNSSRSPWLA